MKFKFIAFLSILILLFPNNVAPPQLPFIIFGYVFIDEVAIPNATILLTNLESEHEMVASSHNDGSYTFLIYHNESWQVGDVIKLKATYLDYTGYASATVGNSGETLILNISLSLNIPPVANFSYSPFYPTINESIQFIDKSYDLDGYIVNHTWDFGDGNISYEKNTSHRYGKEDLYNVSLTVMDNEGDISKAIKQVRIISKTLVKIETIEEIGNEGMFTINVTVIPVLPIAGVQFGLHFNSSLIEAISVEQGNLFNGYSSYFTNGTIDNTNGTISNVAGAITEPGGSVSGEGTFAIITFKAKLLQGIAALNLINVIVKDANGNELPIEIENGEIFIFDNISPIIIDATSSISYTGNVFEFNTTIYDNVGTKNVYVNYWYDGEVYNFSMHKVYNFWKKSIVVLNFSSFNYTILAVDVSGNWNKTGIKHVKIIDDDEPTIKDIHILYYGNYVNITCNITDNIEVNEAYINIACPNGSQLNFSLKKNYYFNYSYPIETYYFFIWANDSSGNANKTRIYSFSIHPKLSYSPSYHNFGNVGEGKLYNATFEIWNNGTGILYWNISCNASWLNIYPEGGASDGVHDMVYLYVNTKGLAGFYTATINISSNGGNATFIVELYVGGFFELPIVWRAANQSQVITIMIHPNASEGIDAFDKFYSSGFVWLDAGLSPPYDKLSRDARPWNETISWVANVFLNVDNVYCNITWNRSKAIQLNAPLLLINGDEKIDMRKTGCYSFILSNSHKLYINYSNDLFPPVIKNINCLAQQEIMIPVNITCQVWDNMGVENVKINITKPDGSTQNITMHKANGKYYYNATYDILGTYEYFIWAIDKSNNGNKSAKYFFSIQDTSLPYYSIEFEGIVISYNNVTIPCISIDEPVWINATDNYMAEWLNYSVWKGYDVELFHISIHDNDANDLDYRQGYISSKINFQEECLHRVEGNIHDKAGNVVNFSMQIVIDASSPSLSTNVGEPSYEENVIWLSSSTSIWLNASDNVCHPSAGVWKIGYSVLENTVIITDNDERDLDSRTGYISHSIYLPDEGYYEINFWAIDYVKNNVSMEQIFSVDNMPPVANAGDDIITFVGEEVLFNASLSYDAKVGIENYTWNFGDGNYAYGSIVYHNYTQAGIYTVILNVTDYLGNKATDTCIVTVYEEFTFELKKGWNFICLPLNTSYETAEDLGNAIEGCNLIAKWDAENQQWIVHKIETAENNFNLIDGGAYFVHVLNDTTFYIYGLPLENVTRIYYIGWNTIGWIDEPITAEDLKDTIEDCNLVRKWDVENQEWITDVGKIKRGEGVFVHIGEYYAIYGYVMGKDGNAICNATMSILNNRTNDMLYTATNSQGAYLFDIST